MNQKFDIASGRVIGGHYFSAKTINHQPTPLVAKEKAHPRASHVHHVHHVHHTKHHKKHK